MVILYLGSLAFLLATAFRKIDDFTSEVTGETTFANVDKAFSQDFVRDTVLRSVWVALLVTLLDLVIALPVGFYLAKVASATVRRALLVSFTLPLWAGYLVKAYAWRAILDAGGADSGGVLEGTFGFTPGLGMTAVVITLAYLWLPYMILPVVAGLERLPSSLLDASSDLGAPSARTFVSVVMPLLVPSIAAGAVFTFSLSLGDYIVPNVVGGKTQLIGNLIGRTILAPNLPLAAAYTMWPILIMVVFLLFSKRLGAFDNL